MKKNLITLIFFVLSGFLYARTILIFDVSADKDSLNKERASIRKMIENDAILSSLAINKHLDLRIESIGDKFSLISNPLISDKGTIDLYWHLKEYFPKLTAIQTDASKIESKNNNIVNSNKNKNREKIILYSTISILIIIFLLIVITLSLQLRKLQRKYKGMVKLQEDIDKQLSDIFSEMGETIYSMSKKASTHLDKLMNKVQKSDNEIDSQLKEVVSIENQIQDSATNLLSFLKLKAKKIVIKKEPFEINSMLDDVMGSVRSLENIGNKELIFNIDKSTPRNIFGDFSHTSEILKHLLEYSLTKGEKDAVRVDIDSYKKSGNYAVRFRVHYYANENEERDPQRFFVPIRDEETGSYKRLGLFISKELSELLGSKLTVSQPGDRSQRVLDFIIYMKSNELPKQEEYKSKNRKARKKNILIINQNIESSEALKNIFSYFNHKVTVLALEAFESKLPKLEKYDIVAIDDRLIDELFIALVRKVKRTTGKNDIKILALHNTFLPPRAFPSDVVSAVVNKPMTRRDAFNTIETLYAVKEKKRFGLKSKEDKTKKREFIREFPEKPNTSLKSFSKFAGNRILVVEDNALNRKMLLKVLDTSGIKIDTAVNGQEAVRIMERSGPKKYGLILMDINMPVMDGYQASRLIRQTPSGKDIPIIALSALDLENEIKRMEEIGMDGYLPKPLNIGRLYSVFEKYLSKGNETITIPEESNPTVYHEIDFKTAMEYTGNNEVLLNEILISFVEAYSNSDKELEKLLKSGKYEDMQKLLLDILGISGTIGAIKLYKSVRNLYVLLRERRINDIAPALNPYSKALRALVNEIVANQSK